MGCSKACRRVSWAPDEKISQIRLYNPQSSPTAAPWNDDFSPGFKKSQIPIIQWRCPPKFEVPDEWRVASGQGSEEIGVQNLRIRQEAEAFYHHLLFIPPNPLFPIETDLRSISGEGETPVISLIPIEERDLAPSVGAADLDLLRKILSNPKMIEELVDLQRNGISSSIIPNVVSQRHHGRCSSYGIPCAAPVGNSVSVSTEDGAMMKPLIPSVEDAVVEKYLSRSHAVAAAAGSSSSSSNGSQFQENGSSVYSTAAAVCIPSPNVSAFIGSEKKGEKVENSKGKKRNKAAVCFYFNSPKGCRRGHKCEFFHDEAKKKRKKNNNKYALEPCDMS